MTDQHHQDAMRIFDLACEISEHQRAEFLDRKCGDDRALRLEVESLLAHHVEIDAPTSTVGVRVTGAEVRKPADAHQQPDRIGPYRVVRQIGRGGMGIVYLAIRHADGIKHQVAIKVLRPGTETEEILRRFTLERQVLAALNHPNIARLYDAGKTEDGVPYFAMEYVEGQSITEYCDTHRLHIDERLQLFQKVCAAVHYAHQYRVIHRDLKPRNILVARDGTPKLLDFGIAKLDKPEIALQDVDVTATGQQRMTPEYASPEQVRGDPISTASDVYTLGVVLYELVTGHRPYRLKTRLLDELHRIICHVDPEKPSTAAGRTEEVAAISPDSGTTTLTPEMVARPREGKPDRLRRRLTGDIDNIVLMAMRKEPQRRYSSAEQFGEDIRRHLDGMPVIARRDTSVYRLGKFVRRHRTGVAAAAAVAIALVGWGATAGKWIADGKRFNIELISERDHAQYMFDRVRGLAHTFMFDFHDEIQELDGSLPARELLVTTAITYLDDLASEVGDDHDLKIELARGYGQIGHIRGGIRNPSYGDMQEALDFYRRSQALWRGLGDTLPDNVEVQAGLCVSYRHIGDILKDSGDIQGAYEAYREHFALAEDLDPDAANHRQILATASIQLGMALRRLGRFDEARAYYEKSLAARRKWVQTHPGNVQGLLDLSVGLLRVAEVFEDVWDREDALELCLEAVDIRQELAKRDPDSGRLRRYLAHSNYFAARVLLNLQRPDDAWEHVKACFAVFEQRGRKNPKVLRARVGLWMGYDIRGRTQLALGDRQAAGQSLEEAYRLARDLTKAEVHNVTYRRMLVESHESLAQVMAFQGDSERAVLHYRQALDEVIPLARSDVDDIRLQFDKARVTSALGELLVKVTLVEARERLDDARSFYARADPASAAASSGLGLTLSRLSRCAIEGGYADEALALARQALDTTNERRPELLATLAAAQSLSGQRDAAIATAEEALAIIRDSPVDARARALRERIELELREYRR